MTAGAQTPPAQDDDADLDPLAFEWSDWPARQHPRRSVALIVGVAAVGVLVGALIESAACGVLAAVLLLATLTNYVLPVWYAASTEGLSVSGLVAPKLLKWSRIDTARLTDHHATLLVVPPHDPTPRPLWVGFGVERVAVAKHLRHRLLEAGVPLV